MKNENLINASAVIRNYENDEILLGKVIAVNGNRIRLSLTDSTNKWFNLLSPLYRIAIVSL